jgi:competence protein ComEA
MQRHLLLLCVFLLAVPGFAQRADLLDINTATTAQLSALPGMGSEYARRVIANRPYTAKNQLSTRGVLPEAEYLRIAGLLIAHRPAGGFSTAHKK